MNSLKKPIFIIGSPRSGTTLLQCILSAHSHLFSLPETHFFSEVMRRISKPADRKLAMKEIQFAFEVLSQTGVVDKKSLRKFLRICDEESTTGKQIFEYIVECYRPDEDINKSFRLVEKTPMHAMFIKEIKKIYPDAKFIHIVRDPRDVISSRLALPTTHSKWLPKYVRNWNLVMQSVEAAQNFMPYAILTIRYEDLVSYPTRILNRICQFLGLVYEPQMLSEFSSQWERNVIIEKEPWKFKVKGGRIISYEAKWRTRISEAQAWLIEIQAYKYMVKYNYLKLASTSIGAKLAIVWASYKIGSSEGQDVFRWFRQFIKYLFTGCIHTASQRRKKLLTI